MNDNMKTIKMDVFIQHNTLMNFCACKMSFDSTVFFSIRVNFLKLIGRGIILFILSLPVIVFLFERF